MPNNASELTNLSERLVYALEIAGMRKADLARAIGVKPQVIQFLCTGGTKSSRFTFEIATSLGLSTRWLATGEGEMFAEDDPKYQLFKNYKQIPLLKADDIIDLCLKKHQTNETVFSEWVAVRNCPDKMFAMLMPDTSMDKLIPAESTIFVCYEEGYSPTNGDIVLIFMKQFNALIIRKYCIEKNDILLVAENDKLYKKNEMTEDMVMIGFVKECHFSLKKGDR